MEAYKVTDLSFKYEGESEYAVDGVTFNIEQGDFVLLCGKSGCGKSTLLRLMKGNLELSGQIDGEIIFNGKPLNSLNKAKLAELIGFVMQNPENQLICDDVYGELCFGMSHLGYDKETMGRKVFEIANYFGINHYLNTDVSNLSGGQKQLLAVAGTLCTSPVVLLLDEPTASLDTNSAELLISALEKLNRELGMTIVIAEQRLEKLYPICNKIILMEDGKVSFSCRKEQAGGLIATHEHKNAFPVYVQAYSYLEGAYKCPGNMNEAKKWLEGYGKVEFDSRKKYKDFGADVVRAGNLWLRFEKNGTDVLKGVELSLKQGEISCLLGANGSGKSTLLKALCGIRKCYEGKCKLSGKTVLVSQNTTDIFSGMTIGEEFRNRDSYLFDLFELREYMDKHPYDLSGGELQRAAVVRALLEEPDILFLDEITRGMGVEFKNRLGEELVKLSKEKGLTVLLSSHDIDFCAEYTDTCHLLFNGTIVSKGDTKEIIKNNDYFTTEARIFTKDIYENVITNKDVEELCKQLKTK